MFKIIPAGDSALIIKAEDDISPETNIKVRQIMLGMEKTDLTGIMEMVPSYNELMIYYQPGVIDFQQLTGHIRKAESKMESMPAPPARRVYVPVCYGGEEGPDLGHVAETAQQTEENVIKIHTGNDLLVYMLGFSPGFCYLGGMDARIACPRKATPRLAVPAGSVGIAGNQTGIYPITSPGGWQIIGRTPLLPFRPDAEEPFLFKAGDRIRFFEIDQEELLRITGLINQGKFEFQQEQI